MFDFQPTLTCDALSLRPLRTEDFDDLYGVASDPLIWEQHPGKNRFKPDIFRDFFAEAMASGGALVALDTKDDRIVGSSRFHGYDGREVEIGWTFLARSHWGGFYNRELKQLMLRHAFTFVDRVAFLVGPLNVRSQRAMEKIGGVRAGSRPNHLGLESFLYEIHKKPPAKP